MRILVTNDDGVAAPGLELLVRRLAKDGHDLFVVAPAVDHTGAGGAIGPIDLETPLVLSRLTFGNLQNVPVYALSAPPAMCILGALLGAFDFEPEIVLSGVNAGANTGQALLHSGTVCAALTAANMSVSAVAVSLAAGLNGRFWSTAAELAARLTLALVKVEPGTVFNLNVPDLPLGQLAGVTRATLAPSVQLRTTMLEVGSRLELKLSIESSVFPPESDTELLRQGFATLTPIRGIHDSGRAIDDLLAQLVRTGLECSPSHDWTR